MRKLKSNPVKKQYVVFFFSFVSLLPAFYSTFSHYQAIKIQDWPLESSNQPSPEYRNPVLAFVVRNQTILECNIEPLKTAWTF